MTPKPKKNRLATLLAKKLFLPILFPIMIGAGCSKAESKGERPRLTLALPGRCERLLFSRDGKTIAVVSKEGDPPRFDSETRLSLWDTETGKERLTLHRYPASGTSVTFKPDGKTLGALNYSEGTIRLWNVASGQQEAVFKDWKEQEGKGPRLDLGVLHLIFSDEGMPLLAGVSEDRSLKLWDVSTGKEVATIAKSGELCPPSWNPGWCAVSRGDCLVAHHPEQKILQVWDLGKRKQTARLKWTQGMPHMVLTPAGNAFAGYQPGSGGTEGKTITVWESDKGYRRFIIEDITELLAMSPDGRIVAVEVGRRENGSANSPYYYQVLLLDSATGKELFAFGRSSHQLSMVRSVSGGSGGACFSPNGRTLITYSDQGPVMIWDVPLSGAVH